ncbi:MAG: hypothetical protein PHQ05_09030 [Sterolibacterium sp.]|nr:hypothetical protein [Sterolibacterium sp.]
MSKPHVPVPLDFKLVAKIGLCVAVVSCLGLLLTLLLVGEEKATGYRQIVSAYGMVRQSLGPAMLVFGLAMVAFAGIVTWLFSLYTSFRIAGPLCRISRNLEQQIKHGTVAPVPLRSADSLQSEWQELEASVDALRVQHEELRQALSEVETAIREYTRTGSAAVLELALARLKQAERRVRF